MSLTQELKKQAIETIWPKSMIDDLKEWDGWERWPDDIPANMPLYLTIYYFRSLGLVLYFKMR